MSTNFKSISISITVNFVCSTVPDYEESIQTLIFTTSDNFEEWFKKNAFSHSKTRWLVKKELFCKVWRSSTSFHTNNLIESYHNQLKTFYLGRARRRHCDSLIYTARNVDDRLPSGDFEVFVWFSNCQIKPKRCEKEKISVCF
ncbi:hypothetical protein BCV71DRAFT_269288 [Rhizopus microsporus]|uniref:Uncharacterized protein n=1 Tax=Rhizopus microsporus TaxID=58291 RepID=A0A1X0RJY7_RHIZD|nr:hypothetical protein BCV71DRAFT_269288 [Rhizopus microsporus]